MQWSDGGNAGFAGGGPWLDVNPNYRTVTVETASRQSNSVPYHYRRLLELRREEEALVYGEYDLSLPDHEQLYVYTRTFGGTTILAVLNWSDEPAPIDEFPFDIDRTERLVSDDGRTSERRPGTKFEPYESAVHRL